VAVVFAVALVVAAAAAVVVVGSAFVFAVVGLHNLFF